MEWTWSSQDNGIGDFTTAWFPFLLEITLQLLLLKMSRRDALGAVLAPFSACGEETIPSGSILSSFSTFTISMTCQYYIPLHRLPNELALRGPRVRLNII